MNPIEFVVSVILGMFMFGLIGSGLVIYTIFRLLLALNRTDKSINDMENISGTESKTLARPQVGNENKLTLPRSEQGGAK